MLPGLYIVLVASIYIFAAIPFLAFYINLS